MEIYLYFNSIWPCKAIKSELNALWQRFEIFHIDSMLFFNYFFNFLVNLFFILIKSI